jgi:hypothetical protein
MGECEGGREVTELEYFTRDEDMPFFGCYLWVSRFTRNVEILYYFFRTQVSAVEVSRW